MAWASPTTINISKGFTEVTTYVNTVTNSWVSNLLLIGLWFILTFVSYKSTQDLSSSLAISGWVLVVVGLLLWLGSFITGITFGIVIAFALLTSVPLFFDNH